MLLYLNSSGTEKFKKWIVLKMQFILIIHFISLAVLQKPKDVSRDPKVQEDDLGIMEEEELVGPG